MKKINIKNQKGIAATDSIIAVLLIILFTGIIMTLSYNIYITTAFIKRNSKAIEYAINIFEETEKVYYDDLNQEYIDQYITTLSIPEGYNIIISIEKYEDEETEEIEEDVIKIINLEIKYMLAKKEETLKMSKIKQRENLITPNKPEIEYLEVDEDKKKLPIKYIDETKCEVTKEQNPTWYNYENGNWATILVIDKTVELSEDDDINFEEISENQIYFWIPRYAYNVGELEILFLYKSSEKYLNKENEEDLFYKLTELPENYEIHTIFNQVENKKNGIWLSLEEIKEAIQYPETNYDTIEIFEKLNNTKYNLKYWQNFFVEES